MKRLLVILCVFLIALTYTACKKDPRDELSEEERKQQTETYLIDMGERSRKTIELTETIAEYFNRIFEIYDDCKLEKPSESTILYTLDEQGNFWQDPEKALQSYEEDEHHELELRKNILNANYLTITSPIKAVQPPVKELDDFHQEFLEILDRIKEHIDLHNNGGYDEKFIEEIPKVYDNIKQINDELMILYKTAIEDFAKNYGK